MTSLHVICSLPAHPNQKSWLRLCFTVLMAVSLANVIMILYQKTAFKQAKINLCRLFTYFVNEQTWRIIRKNLRTASLKPKFNRSYYKKGSTKAHCLENK